ncbi:MAG TPA: hypothetical protein VM529_13820 [Gemmata sp.]|nr:hypothetical protein [Gemmata sp.]
MSLRSWAIRGLILTGVAAVAGLGWVASTWVSPERVRAQVVAHLSEQFAGAEVHVGSAHMRIFGGIAVRDVRITLPGAAAPFLSVPSGVLYHDKEQVNRGRMVIKKVELDHPEFRLERGPDGRWNVGEMLGTTPPDRPLPTLVVRRATVRVTDQGPDPLPAVTLTDADVTLLNDPLPILAVQVKAVATAYGPVNVRARLNRVSGGLSVALEMPDFPAAEAAADAARRFAPDLAPHVAGLSASASVTADLTYTPGAAKPWQHDVRLDLRDAKFTHPDLPHSVEKLSASVRVADGRARVENATAVVNGAKVTLSLETRAGREAVAVAHKPDAPRPDDAALRKLEDHLQRAEVAVAGVAIDDELFKQLPESAKKARRRFSPVGKVDVGYKFSREPGAAGWKRELEVRPLHIAAVYEKFRYPVSELRGSIKRTDTPAGPPTLAVSLVCTAAGQPVTIKGDIVGDGDDPAIDIRVTGANIPMDDTLVAAFPPKYADMVRRFRATGRGSFVAEVVQKPGVNLCENVFNVTVHDGSVNHTQFPVPLQKVKGRLVVRTTATDATRPLRPGEPIAPQPDRDEVVFDSFTATHGGAAVWLNGSKRPIPDSRDQKLALHVGGNNVPLDDDVKAALAAVKAEGVWSALNPTGRVTFAADVELIDRSGPEPDPRLPVPAPAIDPISDLKLTFNFSGPTVTPTFFPYELTDLTAWLEYRHGRVVLERVAARHGETRVKVRVGEVRFFPDGVVWANVGALEVKPFVADEAMLKALPGQLSSAVESLQLKGGAELAFKHLVVLTPPDDPLPPPEPGIGASPGRPVARAQSPGSASPSRPDPVVYWDAELKLAGASLDTGVAWEQVFGAVACRGRYEGTHLGLVRGAAWLDRAVIAKQPVTRVSARLKAEPQAPDPARRGEYLPVELEVADVAGDLFHGELGGEARVVLAEPSRFDLWLTASNVQLDEVAKHYKLGTDADLKGIAQAQLRLYNRPDPKTGRLVVEGSGKIDVPTGRMYNLPVLLDLVKVLKLQAPDKTAFEEAHAVFRIRGDRVTVEQVDLIGKALCLGGSGELDTTGEYVKFEFYTVVSQVLAKMVNTPVGDLTAFLSKNLFKIKLTRENGELKYRPETMPLVTEPARAVADRLRARSAWMFGTGGK